MNRGRNLRNWGLDVGADGQMEVAGVRLVDLARQHGTPLHVVHEERLFESARRFRESAQAAYRGKVSVYYPLKCNSVPAIVETIRRAGQQAEVMTEFELALARRLGFRGEEIIVNGPCKTEQFLRQCIVERVRFIIVDSIEEMYAIQNLAEQAERDVEVLMRVNPDYIPSGMNFGSATGSRKGSAFGLDLKGGEVHRALDLLKTLPRIRFRGFHCHIGTGVRRPQEYVNALRWLPSLTLDTKRAGARVDVIDVGGGFASPTSRELTSFEMLLYQAFGRVPSHHLNAEQPTVADFTSTISQFLSRCFSGLHRPELLYEPGRCITSPNQFLLLTVHRVKSRPGCGTWLITDGGLGTVTLPTYYEYHRVLLANDVNRQVSQRATIIGPACFAGDIVYRNLPLPKVRAGEVLALMDTGAYFTQLESSFGFYRPAIVGVADGRCRILRQRESFENSVSRDRAFTKD